MKHLCAIDGGGIRGILPVCFLGELERQIGKPVREVFADGWIAGTSTGACLTALIQAGVPMKDALAFYTGKVAKKVFSPSGFAGTAKRLAEGYMYDPMNLREALITAMGPRGSGMLINDCPTRVLITAVAADGHTWFMVRDNELNTKATGLAGLVDAALASSCAPTYHAPWPLVVGGQRRVMFDGGAGGFASPGHMTCIEAFEYDTGFTPETTRVIVLGTGFYPASEDPPSGLLATIGWAVSTLVDSSEDLSDKNARREYFRSFPENYVKINPQLPSDIAEDDLSAIPDLVELGQREAAKIDWLKVLA